MIKDKKIFSIFGIFLELKWRYYYKYLKNIELLILDVDGVLTDGGLWIDNYGYTIKRFDVKDGIGIKLLQEIGIKLVLLSGGVSGATEERAKQLGIKDCLTEVKNKHKIIENLQEEFGIPISKTAYVGDDINDIVVRPVVKLFFAPSNASIHCKRKADLVLSSSGGNGVMRELSERLLFSKGLLGKFTTNGWVSKND